MKDRRSISALILIFVVAIGSSLAGILIGEKGGDRRRQLKNAGDVISGTSVSFTERTCARGCVYLPTVLANSGLIGRARGNVAKIGISVVAQASASCEKGKGTIPVDGARVIILTEDDRFIGQTNPKGYALFGATNKAATIHIEWPAGFFPCPNSRPVVELPSGFGAVKFAAQAAAYP